MACEILGWETSSKEGGDCQWVLGDVDDGGRQRAYGLFARVAMGRRRGLKVRMFGTGLVC